MRLISILSNSGGRLVAEQRPQNINFLLLLFGFAIVAAVIFIVRVHAYKMLLLPGCLTLLLLFLANVGEKVTYRVTVDQASHTITSDQIKGGKVVGSAALPASDLTSAEMQFNRGARTIVLIGRDGSQHFPLGEAQVQDEPDQYVILNALREAIGQPVLPAEPAAEQTERR